LHGVSRFSFCPGGDSVAMSTKANGGLVPCDAIDAVAFVGKIAMLHQCQQHSFDPHTQLLVLMALLNR
jgi:hypothetical protein